MKTPEDLRLMARLISIAIRGFDNCCTESQPSQQSFNRISFLISARLHSTPHQRPVLSSMYGAASSKANLARRLETVADGAVLSSPGAGFGGFLSALPTSSSPPTTARFDQPSQQGDLQNSPNRLRSCEVCRKNI